MMGAEPKLPVVAYIHRDGDEKDGELVDLMVRFEKEPTNCDIVLQIAKKRIQKGDNKIAKMWLEYAPSISDVTNEYKVERMLAEIGEKLFTDSSAEEEIIRFSLDN